MNRTTKRLSVFLILAGVVAAAAWHYTRPAPVKVVLHTLTKGRVEATVANTRVGTVKAPRRARLAPTIGGQVSRLPVREGARVSAGQVLLELWNKDLAAQHDLAESEVAAAQAKAEEACLLADVAARESARLLLLQNDGLASEEVVDQEVVEAQARQAACRAARASVLVAESQVAVAQAALERTVLTAPFDGIIAEVNAELGEYVMPSPPGIPTPPAIDLIDDSHLYVSAPIDEIDAPAIRTGIKARITLDAVAGREFEGRVRRIAPYVLDREKQARTVEVEVDWVIPHEGEGLLAGYSADVEIILQAEDSVLRVPTEAVLEGHKVLVYRPSDGYLEERKFEPGIANWKVTQVVSGLTPGEYVVVSLEREGVIPGAYGVAEEPRPAIE